MFMGMFPTFYRSDGVDVQIGVDCTEGSVCKGSSHPALSNSASNNPKNQPRTNPNYKVCLYSKKPHHTIVMCIILYILEYLQHFVNDFYCMS